ncbi:hypothetical protein HHK36_013778 [Tetracentron sinense]|uniref:TRF2/HOY1 PH-like domain-containing protein n=1 Tax=Tetracentron sinense TaxID=13715 RepID=A0A834Z6S8_TETSI|nr:hypothetical protein HHK36_013778 [Tetracentron sinense]
MVKLMSSGTLLSETEKPCRNNFPVKLEIEDSLDEEHGPLEKKPKLTFQQWSSGTSSFPIPPSQYNPLDEPSPLGLRLRKSPSLLDLIQMKLSQGNPSTLGVVQSENLDLGKKKDVKGTAVLGTTDKLKASNFPTSLLRIGSWECVSRYEGDLVAKCYFAKHKLVWEVLDGGLKSKIEIQWSDIMALKANYPDNGPGTLDIVLSRQPLFFRETNPQPRKHTLWQATSDFTGGQASIHRAGGTSALKDAFEKRHFLQCPQGLLGKHFEKLIQCDPRLNLLSQQPEIMLESPYFEPGASIFEDPDESKCHGFEPLKSDHGSIFSGSQDVASPSAAQSSSSKSELLDPVGRVPEYLSWETPSPSSVMDDCAIEEKGSSEAEEQKGLSHWDQLKLPGLHPSISMTDLVSHIGHCISEQRTSGNPLFSGEGLQNSDMLEEITHYLLSDSQFTSASDEQSLMSRVNSLCCLLQKDPPTVQNLQFNSEGILDRPAEERNDKFISTPESARENKVIGDFLAPEGSNDAVSGFKQSSAMSRKDSVELLLHLPRIASLPQFLFNISEDVNNQARY